MSYQQFRPAGLFPPVVKNLLIINGILFAAEFLFAQKFQVDLADYLGFHYFSSQHFQPFQFVTYMFMHGGFLHIFSNMFGLFMFGSPMENYWGGKRFLTYYMITGIGAALIQAGFMAFSFYRIDEAIHAFMAAPSPEGYLDIFQNKFSAFYDNPDNQMAAAGIVSEWKKHIADSGHYAEIALRQFNTMKTGLADVPTVGASGALFGILLAFGMFFPNTEVMMLFFPVPIKAKIFVIIYGAFELYSGIQDSPGDNVAHFAHLGGMLFGFVLIKIWSAKGRTP